MKITVLFVLLLVLKAFCQDPEIIPPDTMGTDAPNGTVSLETSIELNPTITVEGNVTEIVTTEVNVTEVVTTEVNVTEIVTTEVNVTEVVTSEVNVTEIVTSEVNVTEIVTTEQGTEVPPTEVNMTATEEITLPSGLSAEQLNSNCIYGTLLFNGKCACWSGAFGPTCEMGPESVTCGTLIQNPWDSSNSTLSLDNSYPKNLDSQPDRDFCMDISNHPSCSSWGIVQPLRTLNPPRLESANFLNNNLNILISQPMVNGRADIEVFLNDDKLFSTFPICSYPNSDFILKQVTGCNDVWNFSIPWDQAIQCGWKLLNEEGYRTYRGQVIVHNHEWLSNINEFRFIQSVLRIKIRFQVFISISFNSFVYSQPNLRSGITQQIISVNLGESATVQLTTLLNYPYMLTNGTLVLYPEEKIQNVSSTFSNDLCAENNNNGAECKQRWNIQLLLNNDTCTLDGNYRMNFTEACSDTSIQCPLDGTLVSIDFTLVSENFCAEISIDIGLYGTIKVYESADFLTIRNSFIQGKTAYFLVEVSSDQNTQPYNDSSASILFSSVSLVTVSLRVDVSNVILRLYQNGTLAEETYDSGINEIKRSNGNSVGFSFIFTEGLISALNATSKTQITVGAEVLVTYNFGSSENSTKRELMAEGEQEKTTFSTTNTLDTSSNNEDSNIGNVLIVSLLLVLITFFF